jgi:uncharacterized membrane protein
MFYFTLALFLTAAIIGVIILKNWLTSANTSRTVVILHGIFAAAALVLLVLQVLRDPTSALKTSLGLFLIAAIGGFYMFFKDLKGKFSPIWLAITHGVLALAGFGVLLYTIL